MKRPIGSFDSNYFKNEAVVLKQSSNGLPWDYSRPVPYYSIVERIKMAWDILTYKADAIYWN